MMDVQKLNEYKKADGTITVFLSLIFLLVLSFVLTNLEAARLGAIQSTMVDSMYAAMNGVFSEYYGPLYEEYHIFGHNATMSSSSSIESHMKEKVEGSIAYTLNPTMDFARDLEYFQYLDTELLKTEIQDITYLSGYNGNLFYTQAVDYMKYYEVGELVDYFLSKLNLIDNNQTVAKVYEKKIELEEELVAIDKTVMSLMEIIDGLDFEDQQLNISKEGKININSTFMKKYTPHPITMEGLQIYNEIIYTPVSLECINPNDLLDAKILMLDSFYGDCVEWEEIDAELNELFDLIETSNESLKYIQSDIEIKNKSFKQLKKEYEKLEKKNDDNEYDAQLIILEAQILKIQREISQLEERQSILSQLLTKYKEQYASSEQKYMDLSTQLYTYYYELLEFYTEFTTALNHLQLLAQEGIAVLEEGILVQQGASTKIEEYGKGLEGYKEILEPEMFESLEEDFKSIQKYGGVSEGGQMNMYDFSNMKSTLSYNEGLYSNMLLSVPYLEENYNSQNIQQVRTGFANLKELFDKVSFEYLAFDYSTLSMEVSTANPLKTLNGILGQGVLSLVLDDSVTLSEKEIDTAELPSVNHQAIQAIDEFYKKESGSLLDQVSIGSGATGFSQMFSSFSTVGSNTYQGKDLASDLAKLVLFQEYATTHFKSFNYGESKNEVMQLPSALDYELEYLLFEQSSDTLNMGSTVNTLVLLRTITNFISLVANKERSNEARIIATALVGFTGLTILVSITKMILLMVWALEEALVDVSILLMGKKTPFLKSENDWHIKSTELLLISGSFIQQKAKDYQETNSGLSFGYKDYLNIFIFLKSKESKAYLMMDLIQLNLQYRYQEPFYVDQSVVGCTGTITYKVHSKFIALPFVRDVLQWDGDGFVYDHSAGYSY